MPAITATNVSTPSQSLALSKARIEQARREADSAEDRAQDLRAQADEAERDAQERNEKARKLGNASSDSTYTSALRSSSSAVPVATQTFLERMYTATSAKFAAQGNALKEDAAAAPVLNAQGQATGRILNLSA
jgi:hypothetical protein